MRRNARMKNNINKSVMSPISDNIGMLLRWISVLWNYVEKLFLLCNFLMMISMMKKMIPILLSTNIFESLSLQLYLFASLVKNNDPQSSRIYIIEMNFIINRASIVKSLLSQIIVMILNNSLRWFEIRFESNFSIFAKKPI